MPDKKTKSYLGKRVVWTSSAAGTTLTKLGFVIAQRIDGKWQWLGTAWKSTYKRNDGMDLRWASSRCELIVELYATKPSPRHRTWSFCYGKPRYMQPRLGSVKLAAGW